MIEFQEAAVATHATNWRQKSTEAKQEVGAGGQRSPSMWPHNPATRFWPSSATVVSAQLFLH